MHSPTCASIPLGRPRRAATGRDCAELPDADSLAAQPIRTQGRHNRKVGTIGASSSAAVARAAGRYARKREADLAYSTARPGQEVCHTARRVVPAVSVPGRRMWSIGSTMR